MSRSFPLLRALARRGGAHGALAACVCALAATVAAAQVPRGERESARRDTSDTPSLPIEVAREVEARYNAPGTTRVAGTYALPAGRTVTGDVAVLDGPVTIAGRITGRLTAINADVTFRPGARVDGDVIVVGGVVDGRRDAGIGGELRIHRQPLRYRREGDQLVATVADERESLWWRWRRARGRRPYAGVTLSSGRTYNRVEGLPIWFGPSYEQDLGAARLSVDAFGIFRTAEQFAWDSANVGHLARIELRLGRGRGVRLGGRLFDEVAAVEDWQLGGPETGLAAFFLHRDFRDYYNRHGGALFASLFATADASVTVSYSDQRWAAREARDVFTILRNGSPWRENPAADEGRVHLTNATLLVDTRNDESRPWAGWYVEADYERGTGRFTRIAPTSGNLLAGAPPMPQRPSAGARDLTPGERTYGRAFLDLRRYNRLSPDAQLNLRLVLGGWLHGDELPLQRRFSLTGPGAIAGLDFRRATRADDLALCSTGGVAPAGAPAQCERMALLQAEYRGDIRVALFGEDAEPRFRRRGWRTEASWVLFADAGRGWLLGEPQGDLVLARDDLPGFETFLTDVGAGVEFGHNRASEFGGLGVYVAKSVSRPSQGANVFVRIRRRF